MGGVLDAHMVAQKAKDLHRLDVSESSKLKVYGSSSRRAGVKLPNGPIIPI